MTTRNRPRDAAVFGVDIGKNVFHVVGLDGSGQPVQRARFRRDTLLQFFERAAPAIVGMEACPGSQWLARKIQGLGHTVRIVPAQFVKWKSACNWGSDALSLHLSMEARRSGALGGDQSSHGRTSGV